MSNQEDKNKTEQKSTSDSSVPIHPGVSGFSERLRRLIGDNSIASFARQCGVAESTIRSYFVRGKTPRMEHLISISSVCGVTADWLATGKGIKYTRDLKYADERLRGAPPAVSGNLPPELEPYRKRLDALLVYLSQIDDPDECELIINDFVLRAEKTIELSELKHTVAELRAAYNKNTG